MVLLLLMHRCSHCFWGFCACLVLVLLCSTVIRKVSQGFYFRETSHMRSFVKIKLARNVEIRLSITDEGNSCSGANLKRGKYVFNAIRKN